ncbi:hypothetical protein B0O99DRAFT_694743 [Bisporella sp. PMI_857]|nr:hypothetical protein B0O99DRAFT_694743 [Bisporella sp. PMI_857]
MEHLKQTGTPVDSQPEATLLQCNYSSARSSSSSPTPTARKVYTPPSPVQPTKPAYSPAPAVESYPSEPLKPQLPSPVEKPSNIAEFNPKRSIVVTPVKMATYYSTYALEPEVQHYASIFKVQSNEKISRLYQDLVCEHHLVQDATFVPIVPALTPVGFARWMSPHIMAYPDQEAKRLEKAVLDLPIDADGLTEGKVERLPKQISRHLLPEKEDRGPKTLIETVVANFF